MKDILDKNDILTFFEGNKIISKIVNVNKLLKNILEGLDILTKQNITNNFLDLKKYKHTIP